MPQVRYRCDMVGGVPVVTAPAEALARVPAGERDPMAEIRTCEQCGTAFVPQREHARFCAVACRAAWNREHMGDPAVVTSADRRR